MAHQVQVNANEIVLPDGRQYDDGAVVTLTEREFSEIRQSLFDNNVLTDLGSTGGGGAALADLADVAIGSPQVGDTLTWNGSHWTNDELPQDIDVGGPGANAFLTNGDAIELHYTFTANNRPEIGTVGASAANSGPDTIVTAQSYDPAGFTHGSPQDLSTIATTPLDVGDYHLTQYGVTFRTPGLYYAQFYIDFTPKSAVGSRAARFQFASFLNPTAYLVFREDHPNTSVDRVVGQFFLPVLPIDTTDGDAHEMMMVFGQNSGGNGTAAGSLLLAKVVA